VIAVILLVFPAALTAESDYVTGTLLEITKQVESHPINWLWDTPVFWSDTVSYELRVRVGNELFWCTYTPEVQPGFLPGQLHPDAKIDVRIERRRLFIRRLTGGELETVILRRSK
jgi:hypothetical protein